MDRLVFPENTGSLPQAKRSLGLKRVFAVVYCFGGLSGIVYLLSKFVVSPLFDQLTFDRRILVEEARERLTQLNMTILGALTRIPAIRTTRSDYVEQTVQADSMDNSLAAESPNATVVRDLEAAALADKYIAAFRRLQEHVKSLDPNEETTRAQSAVASQAHELAKTLRNIQFEAIPSTMMAMSIAQAKQGDGSHALSQAVIDCRQEIRSLKSSILSG